MEATRGEEEGEGSKEKAAEGRRVGERETGRRGEGETGRGGDWERGRGGEGETGNVEARHRGTGEEAAWGTGGRGLNGERAGGSGVLAVCRGKQAFEKRMNGFSRAAVTIGLIFGLTMGRSSDERRRRKGMSCSATRCARRRDSRCARRNAWSSSPIPRV